MADNVITKEIQTRIALKLDTYQHWTDESVAGVGANLVLLPGEIGLCEIPGETKTVIENGETVNVTTAPTILFKVGTSEKKPFKQLPWASAKAADVYGWAKASDVKLTVTTVEGSTSTKAIEFVGTDKKITLDYLTEAEVLAITNALAGRVGALETAVGASGELAKSIDTINDKLDVINGDADTAGSINNAIKQANAAASTAEQNAKGYADGLAETLQGNINTVSGTVGEHTTAIGEINETIGDLDDAYKAADLAINNKIGTGFDATNTVAKAVEAAQKAADDAAKALEDELAEGGQIHTNAANIATNAGKIGEHTTAIERIEREYKAADEAIEGRLEKVETFFEGAAEDGVQQALDTLVEIQTFINTDGTTAQAMVDGISKNAGDIADLRKVMDLTDEENPLSERLQSIEGNVSTIMNTELPAVKGNVTTLQNVTAGYTANGSIKAAVDKAQEDATAAGNLASANQGRIKTLEDAVNAEETGLADTHELAKANEGNVASLLELTSDYADLQAAAAIVTTGDNSNAKLREDVDAVADIVTDAAKGNNKLYTDLAALTGKVDHTTTGLAATYNLATANQGRIASLEENTVKYADQLILQCGDSDSNVFTIAATN